MVNSQGLRLPIGWPIGECAHSSKHRVFNALGRVLVCNEILPLILYASVLDGSAHPRSLGLSASLQSGGNTVSYGCGLIDNA